jgi:uncharacterized metal-binding protein YceD (DUF177 family)
MTAPAPEFSRPEFSRIVSLATLPHGGRALSVTASEAECRALAARFGLPAIAAFSAELHLKPLSDGRVRATGRLAARVTQVCIVALEPFAQDVTAPVAVTFVPAAVLEEEGEGALDPESADEEPYDGGAIDVGEMLAQSLSLALDPWPRNPASDLPPAAGGDDEAPAPASPFAVLARRRR